MRRYSPVSRGVREGTTPGDEDEGQPNPRFTRGGAAPGRRAAGLRAKGVEGAGLRAAEGQRSDDAVKPAGLVGRAGVRGDVVVEVLLQLLQPLSFRGGGGVCPGVGAASPERCSHSPFSVRVTAMSCPSVSGMGGGGGSDSGGGKRAGIRAYPPLLSATAGPHAARGPTTPFFNAAARDLLQVKGAGWTRESGSLDGGGGGLRCVGGVR